MSINHQYTNYVNSLVDQYFPYYWLPVVIKTNQLRLDDLAYKEFDRFFKNKNITNKQLIKLPPFAQEQISLMATSFTDWLDKGILISPEVIRKLLDRFKFSRSYFEGGSDTEILLRRIFDETMKYAPKNKRLEVFARKRNHSILDKSSKLSILLAEKTQALLGKILSSQFMKTAVTFLIYSTTIVALYVLFPSQCLTICKTYLNFIYAIPWALNETQKYRFISLLFAIVTWISRNLTLQRHPNYSGNFLTASAFLGLHYVFSEIATQTGISLSTFIGALISTVSNGPGILLLPYLAPIVWPIMGLWWSVDYSTSFLSQILLASSDKLTEWRVKKEILEARDLWIGSILE